MRVLIDYRPALRDPSGVGEATRQLVHALATAFPRNGSTPSLELAIFSSSWKDRLHDASPPAGVTALDRRIPVRLLNLLWHRVGWPPIETLTGAQFDVAHSPHPLLLPARHAAQVVTIHDLHFLDRPDRTHAEVRRDYPALVRAHAHQADCIITPSHYTAREVTSRLEIPPDRLVVCPHGSPDWPTRREPARAGYLLFMGTLEPRKNIGGLLDAYERLADAPELILAGHATSDASAWLDRISRAPLAGRVRYIGYVNPNDRYALYAGARALVLPSFDEGFGLPALEAMHVGVPVVASNRGALPEVVGDAGPLVNPDDPAELADALSRVLNEPGFADHCIDRGVCRAREFSWSATAQRVRSAYEQAIEHRARRLRH